MCQRQYTSAEGLPQGEAAPPGASGSAAGARPRPALPDRSPTRSPAPSPLGSRAGAGDDAEVIVVGAGIGGLVAAALLAHAGQRVLLLEQADRVGGKLRAQAASVPAETAPAVDCGPTVFTLKPWFEALFERLGTTLDQHLVTRPLAILARHAWADGAHLDLLADRAACIDAIGHFAGAAEARRYAAFQARSARIFAALEHSFMRAPQPNPLSLVWRAGLRGLPALAGISPFARLMDELAGHFEHPRLRQLFGRYATYCGSSPFAAPATLMLVAHAEQRGVWTINGGMLRLAQVLAGLAQARGATLRLGCPVAELLVEGGLARGVRLADGQTLRAPRVLFNGDSAALAQGLLGPAARAALPRGDRPEASLSALTATGLAETWGFELAHHTVFFGDDTAREFDELFHTRHLPSDPTVYVCAQDRDGPTPAVGGAAAAVDRVGSPSAAAQAERLFWLVNAPALRPGQRQDEMEIEACEHRTLHHLRRCGLGLRWLPGTVTRTTPRDFAMRYPGTGGALYGRATHGWQASFQRPGSASRIPGLWLAGGSVHPGPGLPMAATSGWLAAEAMLAQTRSSSRRVSPTSTFTSLPTVMPGGTSTP